jgi:hypothetical protein
LKKQGFLQHPLSTEEKSSLSTCLELSKADDMQDLAKALTQLVINMLDRTSGPDSDSTQVRIPI